MESARAWERDNERSARVYRSRVRLMLAFAISLGPLADPGIAGNLCGIALQFLAARHAVQLAAVPARFHRIADLRLGRGGTRRRAATRARAHWNTAVAGGAPRPNHT